MISKRGGETSGAPRRNSLRVIGIDPGLASTGWGVIDYAQNRFSLVGYGVIETPSSEIHGVRLLKIFNSLNSIIDEFSPNESAMETLYFAKNVTSAMGVSEARGVATLSLAIRGIPLGEYKPNQIKQAVTGTATADKALVERCVKMLLGLETEPKPDHAADALAGAITHVNFNALSARLK